jgi:DNA topoisomerase-1
MNSKILLIVESPAKCKKIESFLGNEYKVVASCGHICKLSDLKQINFDSFDVSYQNDKHKVIKMLKEETKKSKEVILATDDDREGEAISWHICKVCKLDIKTTKKIVFQEITKESILKALKNPAKINMNNVDSQQTRQILDILVGFKISPLLWKYVQSKLSAGRCQTPALKLVYDNEMLFEERNQDTNYTVKGYFGKSKDEFVLSVKISKDSIEEFMQSHHGIRYQIQKDNTRHCKSSSPEPLITSTLQQKASSVLKMNPKQTMRAAQTLYENGLITYMRTDSVAYSNEFVSKCKSYIRDNYDEKYVTKKISFNQNKNSNKKTQDAHEAIRVTDLDKSFDDIVLDHNCKKLYKLIYTHTIQSMMSDFEYKSTKYFIGHIYQHTKYKYEKTFEIVLFDGWKILEGHNYDDLNDKTSSKMSYFDNLKDNIISLSYLNATEKLVSTLSHFNEATLIRELEKRNIGRPSTYASILDSIVSKKYVEKTNINNEERDITNYLYVCKDNELSSQKKRESMGNEKNRLKITILGKQVIDFIYKYFPDLFDFDFTGDMENNLDLISNAEVSKVDVLSKYLHDIESTIKKTKDDLKSDNIKEKNKAMNSFMYDDIDGESKMIKHGPYGYYVSHGNSNTSLKGLANVDISKIIKLQKINDSEIMQISNFLNSSKIGKYIFQLNDSISIREGKYGKYIFYKTKTMKKPSFYKLNYNKCEHLKTAVDAEDKDTILKYVRDTYDVQ